MKGQGGAITRAPNHSGGTEILREHRMITGAPKNPNNFARTFYNTVHLLPEDLRLENGGAKLASWPGRHLTSLRLSHSGKLFANVNICSFLHAALWFNQQGQGGAITRSPNHSGGAEILRERQKVPTMSHVHSSIQ